MYLSTYLSIYLSIISTGLLIYLPYASSVFALSVSRFLSLSVSTLLLRLSFYSRTKAQALPRKLEE